MTRNELIESIVKVGIIGVIKEGHFDTILNDTNDPEVIDEIKELISLILSEQNDSKTKVSNNTQSIESAKSDISNIKLTKANLVDGKVPYSELPNFPTGRKVNVDSVADMLKLSVHQDLTLAYLTDTGDVWALDASEDPSNLDNWSLIGGAQAVGVQSFNARNGNVVSQNGDYNTSQITETTNRRFVTPSDVNEWQAKETTQGSQSKVDTLAQQSDLLYVKKTSRGKADGVAPLDSNMLIPLANLPVSKLGGVSDDERKSIADSKTSLSKLDGEAEKKADKGVAGGYVPLNSDSKIDDKYLNTVKRNVVNGKVTSSTPIYIDCGNARLGLSWTNAGEVKCFIRAVTGSVTVDLRSSSMWGGSGTDSYAYDGVTYSETPVNFDAAYYTRSNECTFWRLRENNRVWEIKCFASGAGERITLWSDLIYSP